MHLPVLDPNVVLWFNVVADVVTTGASIGAFTVALKHYLSHLRDKAREIQEKL